ALCRKNKTHSEWTIPYNPEQNGVAERTWGILANMARAMLKDSGMPKEFWPHAMVHAAYLRNRLPTRANTDGSTPLMRFLGQASDIDRTRVWGSVAYIHVPKE